MNLVFLILRRCPLAVTLISIIIVERLTLINASFLQPLKNLPTMFRNQFNLFSLENNPTIFLQQSDNESPIINSKGRNHEGIIQTEFLEKEKLRRVSTEKPERNNKIPESSRPSSKALDSLVRPAKRPAIQALEKKSGKPIESKTRKDENIKIQKKGLTKQIPSHLHHHNDTAPQYDEGETLKDVYEQWLVYLIDKMKGPKWTDEAPERREFDVCSANINLKNQASENIISSFNSFGLSLVARVVRYLFQLVPITEQQEMMKPGRVKWLFGEFVHVQQDVS